MHDSVHMRDAGLDKKPLRFCFVVRQDGYAVMRVVIVLGNQAFLGRPVVHDERHHSSRYPIFEHMSG